MAPRTSHLQALGSNDASRARGHIAFLHRVGIVRRELRRASTVGALFASAAELACRELHFDRAVVLSVESGTLRADTTDSIPRPDSDRLRRAVLATPITVRPDMHEAEMIRLMRPSHAATLGSSTVAEALGLRCHALAPVVVDGRTLALLVADRAAPGIDDLDVAVVSSFAEMIASALELVVLRARQRELLADLQSLTASTQALMREMVDAPVTLPSAHGQRVESFPLAGPVSGESAPLRELLTESQFRIAALLVQGRSNREIAEELILSPETVKANVARILRKLGVSNRVAAAAAILKLTATEAA